MKQDFGKVVKQFTVDDHKAMHNLLYDAVVHLRGHVGHGEVSDFDKLSLQTKWEMVRDYIMDHADDKKYTQFSAVELLNFADIQRDGSVDAYNKRLSCCVDQQKPELWLDVKECIDSAIDAYEMQTFENYKF